MIRRSVKKMRLEYILGPGIMLALHSVNAQQSDTTNKDRESLKFAINKSGSHYFQVTFLNQAWVRYIESNPGTTQFGAMAPDIFDIGLRRTRIQMFGQITDRTFLYLQFGQNNFNMTAGYPTGNRKIAAFFHDALCEYRLSKGDQLKIGAGMTVMNGVSRFSQPSVGTIMTLDLPVFLQYSVDQIDQFDRRLAVYARGLLGKLDYRVYTSSPFPVNSNGNAPPKLSKSASFIDYTSFAPGQAPRLNNQFGCYFAWNFLENEPHTTPYMSGTYLGSKRIWNIAAGAVYQKAATWGLGTTDSGTTDTSYYDMIHLGIETFADMPLNREKGSAINAAGGYYLTNYGKNYLRYNGLMNPATGSSGGNPVQSSAYGNSFPMFGTGQLVYAQIGILLPKQNNQSTNRLMPYLSTQIADYEALQHHLSTVVDAGLNWLISKHRSKISVDFQNRPVFSTGSDGSVNSRARRNCVIVQYQISI
jgi:hypothetical protein